MTSWTTLLLSGFLGWMATVIVFCSADCNLFPEFPADHGCNCFLSNQTGLLLTGCEKELKLNLAKLYRLTYFKSMIAIRDSAGLDLCNDEDEMVLNDVREVSLILSNVAQVNICSKAFDQIVVNAVFHNIKNLDLTESSFSSCWGTAWLLNSSIKQSMTGVFSSSDMVVYKDRNFTFTIHSRPAVTPRQKFQLVYHLAAKVDDLEITMFAILALLGAIVLTLIGLTILIASKSTQLRLNSAFIDLPDVVPTLPLAPVRKRANNPVTRVSRISRAIFRRQHASNKVALKVQKLRHATKTERPPLPIPVSSFETC